MKEIKLPMTFTNNVAIYCKGSFELKKFLVKYAYEKGVPIYTQTMRDVIDEAGNKSDYPNLIFSNNHIVGTYISPDGTSNRASSWISVDEFLTYCDNWKEANNFVTVPLNKEYSATINKKERTVTVGCQKFTFEAIENLRSKMHL
jgi:predicted  nucleic acid-binding Zn ribbon protein